MATSSDTSTSFDKADARSDEMHSTIEAWIYDLVDAVEGAQGSEVF